MKVTPEQILNARRKAGLTQAKAAKAIMHSLGAWQKWEWGTREMHPALFDYFLIVTKQKNAK